jgi:excisionase family DNA binding protein
MERLNEHDVVNALIGRVHEQGESSITASRYALSVDEAAESLGVSRDFFDEHIRPGLRLVRVGRRLLVPVTSVLEWLDENASKAVDR